MIQKFKDYFAKLERLSIAELDRSAEKLVVAEHRNIARLIAHIAEMSARKAALELGYRNLFDYCVRRLNVSEGAVPARMHVANVSRKFPELLAALAESKISLTVASLLAPHVTRENVDKLIADCAGKTRKATEEYLVAIRPKPVFAPSIRRQPRPASKPAPPPLVDTQPPPAPEPRPAPTPSPPIVQPAEPEVFNFRFAAGREFKDKFERLAEVVGVENAQQQMAELFEKALDIALDKKDPKRKLERRRKREKSKSRSNEIPKTEQSLPLATSPRKSQSGCSNVGSISASIEGWTALDVRRAMGFRSSTCGRSYKNHDERFLRLLCAAHNRLAAERVYGAAYIQRKIDARRATVGRE